MRFGWFLTIGVLLCALAVSGVYAPSTGNLGLEWTSQFARLCRFPVNFAQVAYTTLGVEAVICCVFYTAPLTFFSKILSGS